MTNDISKLIFDETGGKLETTRDLAECLQSKLEGSFEPKGFYHDICYLVAGLADVEDLLLKSN